MVGAVRTVSISLDGFKTSHERIRVGSRYDKVVENTMSLVEARRRRGAVRPQIVVNLTRVESCSAPWAYVGVLADGKITLCCHDVLGVSYRRRPEPATG